nr:RagB/SusD family nutrient uptake outer membrane protein [uncultured Carboxylicivirga sp.]
MKNIQFIAILILSLGMFSGCVDFNLKPYDGISVDEALRNETDAQTILNGVYTVFKGSESYGIGLSVFPALMTDAAFATTSYTNTYGDIYAWKLNPGLSEVANMWTSSYAAIYNANFIINGIDAIDGDSANLSRIKGEALTARALFHYNLVRMYGKAYSQAGDADLGIPFVTENKIQNPGRNTVKEVYDFIVADIKDAMALLPVEIYNDNTYFNLAFAQGLMARVALDMENYEDAVYYAAQVIGNSDYELASGQGFKDMFTNDRGTEIIWKVAYTVTDYGSAPGYYFYNRNGSNYSPSPDYIPADWWVNLILENDDVRAETFLNYDYTAWGWSGYLMYKYPTNPMFDQQGLNMPKPMRLAEMYLIRAEAYAYLNEDELAQDDLTSLLENRIKTVSAINQVGDALKELIKTERKKELMFEGFYWFDLKRYGEGFVRVPQANTNVANDLKITPDDYRWQWPIPTIELNANKNIEQNPGY